LINFAHGEIYMLGAFTGMYTIRWLRLEEHPGIGSLIIALIAAMAASATAGFIIERLAYRPLRKSPRINLLITAVGVSLFLQYTGQLVFGSDPQFFPTGVLELEGYNWSYGDLVIEPMQIVALVLALILMFVLQYIIFRTRLGRAMRAVSFNHDLASLMGIPTNQIISATFMLGSALAGAAGVLVGLIYPKIDPLMGTMPGLKAFVAAVLGGIGNVTGAVLGAFTLGLAEEFLVGYWVPINIILAVSLNLVNGFTGQFSIGHAGFMAVGAYVAAVVTMALGANPAWNEFVASNGIPASAVLPIGLCLGGVAAAGAGYMVGMPSLRLRGDYLAIVTLGFGE
ncbi:MAG: hypothetical protein EBU49_15675, partial [Proteobacteria bacterium]|nr:hypothetical protein [Pseudomonadota bacterium]